MALTQSSEGGLKISNAGTNGQYLQKQSGASGGLTWADVPAGVGGATGVDFNDDVKIRLGTGNDSEFVHDGTNTKWVTTNGNIRLLDDAIEFWNRAGNEPIAKFDANGSCELYHDDSKKFETTSAGISVSACNVTGHINLSDTSRIYLGNDNDLTLFHDNTHGYLTNYKNNLYVQANNYVQIASTDTSGSNQEISATFLRNGAVELYYDNSKKFETTADGFSAPTGIDLPDNQSARFGASNDLIIYHDGTDSVIDNNTGALHVKSNSSIAMLVNNTEDAIVANANSEVKLYYDNVKKLETTSYGVLVSEPTGSADAVLKIEAEAGADAYLALDTSNGGGATADVRFQMDGTTKGSIEYANAGGNVNCMLFRTNDNSEKMRIDSSGHLLVGTTTALGANADDLCLSTAGNTGISIKSGTSSMGNIYFADDTSGAGLYRGYVSYNHSGDALLLGTANTTALSIDSLGNVAADIGNIVISTAGKGIDFSATSDASGKDNELLDDYEEGLWTPLIQSAGGSTSKTYTTQKGWYVRVGRVVHMFYDVAWNSGSGPGGNLILNGFPFTTSNNDDWKTQYTGTCMMDQIDIDGSAKNMVFHSWNDSNYGKFYATLDDASWSVTGFDTAGRIIGQISVLATG